MGAFDSFAAKADRLIRQLDNLRLNRGELSALVIWHPQAARWVPAPIERIVGSGWSFNQCVNHSWYLWPATGGGKKPSVQELLDPLLPELASILRKCFQQMPGSLASWVIVPMGEQQPDWFLFLAGFATTRLPGLEPRTRRQCWGNNGMFFAADGLERMRASFPEAYREVMPPNADCWLAKLEAVLQTSIAAIEYLAGLHAGPAAVESQIEHPAEPAVTASNRAPGKRQLRQLRNERIRELAKRLKLKGQWAALASVANADPEIAELNKLIGDKVTSDISRNANR